MMYLFSEASFGEHGQYQILAWVNCVDANVCWGPGLRYIDRALYSVFIGGLRVVIAKSASFEWALVWLS